MIYTFTSAKLNQFCPLILENLFVFVCARAWLRVPMCMSALMPKTHFKFQEKLKIKF